MNPVFLPVRKLGESVQPMGVFLGSSSVVTPSHLLPFPGSHPWAKSFVLTRFSEGSCGHLVTPESPPSEASVAIQASPRAPFRKFPCYAASCLQTLLQWPPASSSPSCLLWLSLGSPAHALDILASAIPLFNKNLPRS